MNLTATEYLLDKKRSHTILRDKMFCNTEDCRIWIDTWLNDYKWYCRDNGLKPIMDFDLQKHIGQE